ncbi:MAG: hypothetical protein GY739_15430 [Mesoflavibacter sp.]|nr:hypothetical protein [Mesoflavibacter sp.]
MSKLIYLIICFLIVGNSFVFSQDKDFQSFLLQSSIENEPGYISELPMIDNINNFIIINIQIDGKNLNFIFDTGSMLSAISKEAAGDTKHLKKISLTDGSGKDEKVNTVKKDIQLNDILFKQIGFAVIDFEHINKYSCIQIDGILGANAIRLCNWQINPSNQILKLSDVPFIFDSEALEIDLKFYNGLLPIIELNFGGDKFMTLLDTGYSDTLSINKNFYSNSKKFNQLTTYSGNGVFIGTYKKLIEQEIKKVELDSIQINAHLFTNVESYITDEKPLLGNGFLKDYKTTINIETNKLYLDSLKKEHVKNKDFGLSFTFNDKKEMIIAFVWENSQLNKHGVKFGDRITQINGVKTDKVDEETYCRIKEELQSLDNVVISILQNKVEHTYSLIRN